MFLRSVCSYKEVEDNILHCYCRENTKSYISATTFCLLCDRCPASVPYVAVSLDIM
jgi:hypothetical protein